MIYDSDDLWSCMFIDKESKAMVYEAKYPLCGTEHFKESVDCIRTSRDFKNDGGWDR